MTKLVSSNGKEVPTEPRIVAVDSYEGRTSRLHVWVPNLKSILFLKQDPVIAGHLADIEGRVVPGERDLDISIYYHNPYAPHGYPLVITTCQTFAGYRKEVAGDDAPAEWWAIHHPRCNIDYRGCHPECPKDVYERTGKWTGPRLKLGRLPQPSSSTQDIG